MNSPQQRPRFNTNSEPLMNHSTSIITENSSPKEVEQAVAQVHDDYQTFRSKLGETIVGMEDVIEQLTIAMICRGHCILQGMPGLAKTLLISQMGKLLDLSFNRIQFTPDLMPADITGSEVLQEDRSTGKRELRFIKGPVFCNLLLADEINRTPPKSQSALLEAMEERQVTIAGETHPMATPFFVLATQNPIEVEGTYPLPEAQLDRFLFKIIIDYPSRADEKEICRRQVSNMNVGTRPVMDAARIVQMQSLVREVIIGDSVYELALNLVRASRPKEGKLPESLNDMVQYGAGPRATIALLMAAKARAILNKRVHATTDDLIAIARPVLRHRLVPTFNAEAAGVDVEQMIDDLISSVA